MLMTKEPLNPNDEGRPGMTKDEVLMTKESRNPNAESPGRPKPFRHSEIRHSLDIRDLEISHYPTSPIRHSGIRPSFVIRDLEISHYPTSHP